MKNAFTLVTSGTAALFAATLALQAQSTSTQTQSTPTQTQSGTQQSGTLSGTRQSSTDSSLITSTEHDAQVTTVIEQIDAQGPMVVERITTEFADVACTEENARKLVEALRTGTPVTLTAEVNGETKTATFTPTGSTLGYGESYIALALAAEALRSAGVSSCATPAQWQAVLLGGPLAVAGTSTTRTTGVATASSSSQFPGILTLRSQGQGWGQIAQTTNVQLGQVMSSARTSLNIDSSADTTLSPTGRSSAEINQSRTTTGTTGTSTSASPGTQSSTGASSDLGASSSSSSTREQSQRDDEDKEDESGKSTSEAGTYRGRSLDDDSATSPSGSSKSSTDSSTSKNPDR